MSHDHCDCVEGLEEHIAWQRDRLSEQDARGLRLAGELDHLEAELTRLRFRAENCEQSTQMNVVKRLTAEVERLREGVRLRDEAQAENVATIERLRGEGIMGRDTAYRRRDAAEARLRRIEEAARHVLERLDVNSRWQDYSVEVLRNAFADQPTEEVTPQTGT